MATKRIKCAMCSFIAEDDETIVMIAILNNHNLTHQVAAAPGQQPTPAPQKTQRMDRPMLVLDIDEVECQSGK